MTSTEREFLSDLANARVHLDKIRGENESDLLWPAIRFHTNHICDQNSGRPDQAS